MNGKGQNLLGYMLQQQINLSVQASGSDTSQRHPLRVYWRIYVKIFVSATELSPQKVAQILSDLIFLRHVAATKLFLLRSKDFYKNSPVHRK